jgi:hypothetical protein
MWFIFVFRGTYLLVHLHVLRRRTHGESFSYLQEYLQARPILYPFGEKHRVQPNIAAKDFLLQPKKQSNHRSLHLRVIHNTSESKRKSSRCLSSLFLHSCLSSRRLLPSSAKVVCCFTALFFLLMCKLLFNSKDIRQSLASSRLNYLATSELNIEMLNFM